MSLAGSMTACPVWDLAGRAVWPRGMSRRNRATLSAWQTHVERLRLELGFELCIGQRLAPRIEGSFDGLLGHVDRGSTGLFLLDRERRHALHQLGDAPGLAEVAGLGVLQGGPTGLHGLRDGLVELTLDLIERLAFRDELRVLVHGTNEGIALHIGQSQLLVEIFLGAHQLTRITEPQLAQQGADLCLARGLLQIEHHLGGDPVLFQQGHCGMWIDATVAASFVTGKDSTVADKVGFALAPDNGLGKRGNWLWAWSLAIPAGSEKVDAAKAFVAWATSKEYTALVASKEGWANVPPGTRTSLYENADYQAAAPFAKMTLDSINAADPTAPTVKPVPYTGVQFVAIPEFAGMATTVGQLFSAALAGSTSVDDALAPAQQTADREMSADGYY